MTGLLRLAKLISAAIVLSAHAHAADKGPADTETRTWWAIAEQLSGDAMEGRDTGSPGYARAAALVAQKFEKAGLKPLGEKGWLQSVPMEEIALDRAVVTSGGRPLKMLFDFSLLPSAAMPVELGAPLAYRGYCGAAALGEVRGKLVICHGTHRAGLSTASERVAAVKAAGGIGMITIADPGFAIEPPRWPFAYARNVVLSGSKPDTDPFVRITLNADSLVKLIATQAHDPAALIAAGSEGKPLPSFDVADRFKASFTLKRMHIVSDNVIGMLPGSDEKLADQAIVLSAHLDGYGYGTPIDGDGLYNGTLDDAAYVALLIRVAEQRHGKGFRRALVFLAVTGEEKGLLGSEWFVAHPTLPRARIVANINLDQLRPIFPLELLTVHALDDTTLGDDARAVAEGMGIAVQKDPEPERNLLKRSDQWNFMQAGIPATAFVFGYRPGTNSERIYREWYRTGYHKPQDDLKQLMDWKAAADFNRFFGALVERVADEDSAPAWKPGSKLDPGAH